MGILHFRPSKWEGQHLGLLKFSEKYAVTHDFHTPRGKTWDMLRRRYDLDTANFRQYHPNVAFMIRRERLHSHKGTSPAPMPPAFLSPPPSFVLPPSGADVPVIPPPAQSVPEPTASLSMGIAMALLLAAAIQGRFASRRRAY